MRPLWRCPKCGRRFVTRNIWHSCSRHRLAEHLDGKPRDIVALYRRFVGLVREIGPVGVEPQASGIALMVRARFPDVAVRRRYLVCGVWLKRRLDHPRFFRIERWTPRDHGHFFRIARPKDLDAEVRAWLTEAYAVGAQTPGPPARARPAARTSRR